MKEADLITTLRRQALDDDVGVICCRPPGKAADYFDLALDLAAVPERERKIVDSAARLMKATDRELMYESWGRLFDLLDEWISSKALSKSMSKILREQASYAVRAGDAPRLKSAVDLHFQCEEIRPGGQDDFVPALIRALIQRADTEDGGSSGDKFISSCVPIALDALEKQGVPDGHGRIVLKLLRESWAAPENAPAGHPLRVRHALRLMEQIGDRSLTVQTLLRAFRETIMTANGNAVALSSVLAEARQLFTSLGDDASYSELYLFALDSVAALHVNKEFPPEILRLLESSHPAPEGLNALFALPVNPAEGGRRNLVLTVCREMDHVKRRAAIRQWLMDRLKNLMALRPDTVQEWVRAGAGVTGEPFPSRAELRELIAWAAGLPELDASRVRVLGELAGGGPAAESARLWCETGDAIGGALRAADLRQWHLIALDLISASIEWKPEVVANSVTRLRSFLETLLMANPGVANVSERIVRCRRDILNGSLLRASLGVLPRKGPDVVPELYAAGLGIGMSEDEILSMR